MHAPVIDASGLSMDAEALSTWLSAEQSTTVNACDGSHVVEEPMKVDTALLTSSRGVPVTAVGTDDDAVDCFVMLTRFVARWQQQNDSMRRQSNVSSPRSRHSSICAIHASRIQPFVYM